MQVSSAERRRAGWLYLGGLLAYYGLATVIALAFGSAVSVAGSLTLGATQFIGMTVLTVVTFGYEDDWWSDFRDQNGALLLGVFGNAAAVAVGHTVGHALF